MTRAFEQSATIGLPDDALGPGAALEGLLLPVPALPDCPGALIAAPHPQMGGSMDSPVATELAFAFEQAGMASLRFNWRGVGASAGAPSGDFGDADTDVAASLAFLRETVHGPITAAGYSFGAAAVLRATYTRRFIRRLVLVAPPPRIVDAGLLRDFAGPVLVVAGAADAFVEVDVLAEWAAEHDRIRLEVIEGADHFFMTHLGQLRRAVDEWLAAG